MEAILAIVSICALVWMVLPLFGARRSWATRETASVEQQLFDERSRLLRAIKDLEHEHEAGSIEEGEYQELRSDYLAEAAAVYRRLDELGVTPQGASAEGTSG